MTGNTRDVSEPPSSTSCAVCGTASALLLRGEHEIAGDLQTSVASGHRLMQSNGTDVYACETCGSLFRDPTEVPRDLVDRYRRDEYGERELVRLHRADTSKYASDRAWLSAHGLTAGQCVLEIGSYAAGLLAVARDSGCRAVGIDAGNEVSDFARGLGFEVITGELEEGMLAARAFDAVFILNCLEQMPSPRRQLAEARRLLRPGGALVVRTPNASFVRHAHEGPYRAIALRSGVLGMPFVRSWSPPALLGLLRSTSFDPVALRGRHAPWIEVATRAA
jgi:SAM-dependent methyltransferase